MKKKALTKVQVLECGKLKEIFNAKKKTLGVTQESIAQEMDASQSAVSHYLNGVNPLNLRAASIFARQLGVDISEFSPRLAEERELVSGVMENQTAYESGPPVIKTTKVPLISWVQAGAWCDSPDPYEPGDAEEWLDTPFKHGPQAFCLTVIGDSMSPEYREGEYILVDPSIEARHGDDVIARTEENKYSFKRLQITPEGTYLLALNQSHPNRKLEVPEDTHICGVVVGSWIKRR